MSVIHLVVGWLVVAGFAALALWGLGARLLRRDPGRWFWGWLAAVQVVAVVQVVVGVILFVMGGRQPLLHYAYGVFPLLALAVAHVAARAREDPWVAFGWAGFFSFGLTLRALMTGLEVG